MGIDDFKENQHPLVFHREPTPKMNSSISSKAGSSISGKGKGGISAETQRLVEMMMKEVRISQRTLCGCGVDRDVGRERRKEEGGEGEGGEEEKDEEEEGWFAS